MLSHLSLTIQPCPEYLKERWRTNIKRFAAHPVSYYICTAALDMQPTWNNHERPLGSWELVTTNVLMLLCKLIWPPPKKGRFSESHEVNCCPSSAQTAFIQPALLFIWLIFSSSVCILLATCFIVQFWFFLLRLDPAWWFALATAGYRYLSLWVSPPPQYIVDVTSECTITPSLALEVSIYFVLCTSSVHKGMMSDHDLYVYSPFLGKMFQALLSLVGSFQFCLNWFPKYQVNHFHGGCDPTHYMDLGPIWKVPIVVSKQSISRVTSKIWNCATSI